jgi:hypothetical protein
MYGRKVLAEVGRISVIEHNDHYHGKDHISYLVVERKPGGTTSIHSHRSRAAAFRRAKITDNLS